MLILFLMLLPTKPMAGTPSSCPVGTVFVKGGSFTMGCTKEQEAGDCLENEKPEYKATVSDFCIGQAPVTLKEWRDVMSPREWRDKKGRVHEIGRGIGDCHPVTHVSWDDVQEYLRMLNKRTGKQYRLPTDAEWEYAARGGSESKGYRYSGSDIVNNVVWHKGNSGGKTREVCQKTRNELGLCDMGGNVSEWVSDIYVPRDVSGSLECLSTWWGDWDSAARVCRVVHRVIRGGSWRSEAKFCRVSSRDPRRPDDRENQIGFRVALTPSLKQGAGR